MTAQKVLEFQIPTPENERKMNNTKNVENVIDRRDFHFWIKSKGPSHLSIFQNDNEITVQKIHLIVERVQQIKKLMQNQRYSEAVTQSARVSLQASSIGLPRTAKLAAEIGEAQMQNNNHRAMSLLEKLDGISSALLADIEKEKE